MKLINCHVENFGSLHAFDYDFQNGLNSLYSPNGGGKSTFAAFIKAMFYGLPADSSRAKFNERRHYYPFSGGKFGGNLTFEWRGGVYRIERFFDKTSSDDVKVLLDGAVCREFSGGVGERVFGLDEQSFARTLFITAEGGELSATGGINAKLAEYASAAAGEYDAEGAVSALDKACKNLQSRGGKGEIPRLEAQVKRCQADISNINAISARLGEKYAQCSSLTARLADIEASERRQGEYAVAAEKWARYDDMCREVEQKRARLNQIKGAYPAGFPSQDDISALNAAAGLAAMQTSTDGQRAKGSSSKKPVGFAVSSALSFALSIIMIVVGFLLMPHSTFAGIAALGAGGLFIIATSCILLIGRKGKKQGDMGSGVRARADGVLKKFNMGNYSYTEASARISRDMLEYQTLFGEAARGEDAARAYARDNGLSERPSRTQDAQPSAADELRRSIAALNRDISDDESIVETLGEKQAELDGALADLQECRTKLAAYTAASQFISEAQRSLSSNFVRPVSEAFSRYSSLLKSALGGKVYVDKNFSVAFEGGGELRPDGHLSGGQRAVVSLCFRLALVDNVFGKDCPFVVLDDPFTDLDEEHMVRAAQLLRDLSKGRQIIYFYCHNSRRV